MDCSTCLNENFNIIETNNDCVIECLEKIKIHYLKMKDQLKNNELTIKALKDKNSKLVSDIFDNATVNKSIDDLNKALNDEKAFEISFLNDSTVRCKEELFSPKERIPRSALPFKNDLAKNESNIPANISFSVQIKKEQESKEILGSPKLVFKNSNNKSRFLKEESMSPKFCLKSGRLRQTRLQLNISRDNSIGPGQKSDDSTFCEEAIEAGPKSNSILDKTKSTKSKPWLLSKKGKSSQNASDFDSSGSALITSNQPIQASINNGKQDSSSVVILTPSTQDIIFLDESSESYNIKSMDLLKDLMNSSENQLGNLKRMERNRIQSLQKTVTEKAGNQSDKYSDLEKKENVETCKAGKGSIKSKYVDKTISYKECKMSNRYNDAFKGNNVFQQQTSRISKEDYCSKSKKQRLFDVDCNDCQMYIKYLGSRLPDEEIEKHIRKCTKHKKRTELNLTPDGFWDPCIKPLVENDPRNDVFIDNRFLNKQKRFPLISCSSSIASNSALKLPAPKPCQNECDYYNISVPNLKKNNLHYDCVVE